MHHPLREVAYSRADTDNESVYNDDAAYSEASIIDQDDQLTISTRRSDMSLDLNQSLNSLNIQVKAVPIRFINKPDFPQNTKMHLVQELYVKFPVFCLKNSPCGQYIAVAGGLNGENNERVPGGSVAIYQLITIKLVQAEDEFSQLSCSIYDINRVNKLTPRTGDVLDICWTNKPGFLFTAGMDKQVSLWHTSSPNLPLMLFPHPDMVSSIAVHPKDDSLLLTGCIDGRLRLWSLEPAKVKTSIDLPHPITAICFTPSGYSAIAGTASGHLYIYGFDENGSLKYHSQIHVRSRRGKNAVGTAKVSGLQSMDGPNGDPMVLVTTNDSRIRMYRLRDKEVKFKFHGIINEDSQLHAMIQGKLVCCASEDGRVGLWKVPDQSTSLLSSLAEKIRGRQLIDSLVSFRAALGKVRESEEQFQTGQPLSSAILLPDQVYEALVAAKMRNPCAENTMRPKHVVTADMTGRVKIFEWGSDLSSFIFGKD